jgi:hypothetical protein
MESTQWKPRLARRESSDIETFFARDVDALSTDLTIGIKMGSDCEFVVVVGEVTSSVTESK